MREGEGTIRLPNNNRFEGLWSRDKKNGTGCHYYLDRGQVLLKHFNLFCDN